jgi:voltage-gated potassium channel
MLLGYSIIAVPTGIVTAEIGGAMEQRRRETAGSHRQCGACHREGHEADARHCKHCGAVL